MAKIAPLKGSSAVLRKGGRLLLLVIKILAVVYIISIVLLLWNKANLLYFPTTSSLDGLVSLADQGGMKPWKNNAGDVIGWVSTPDFGVPANRCLIFHGNAGMALNRVDFVQALEALSPRGAWEIYIMEYPGYGARPGTKNEESLVNAGLEAIDLLRQADHRPVYIMGESLGSAVAAQVASRRPQQVAGMLLVTPFYNLMTVAQYHYPIFPMQVLLNGDYRSDLAVQNYSGPVAFVVAENDEVSPAEFGEKLYQEYKGPKKFWKMAGAGHNTINMSPTAPWWQEVFDFLSSHALITNL